jgi:starch phosphorylase
MKAAMNGAINLSVLDGWWGEGDDKGNVPNGWAIKPAAGHLDEARRDAEEARTLYELLQDKVIPTFYRSGPMGYSPEWVAMSKRSIATIAPRYNVIRMVGEYVKFYAPPPARVSLAPMALLPPAPWPTGRPESATPGPGSACAAWKPHGPGALQRAKVCRWPFSWVVCYRRMSRWRPSSAARTRTGPGVTASPTVAPWNMANTFRTGPDPGAVRQAEYRIRAFPEHALLTHKFELGLMVWL